MCKVPVKLRELVKQRLSAAAEEIFELLERTITEYEQRLPESPASAPLNTPDSPPSVRSVSVGGPPPSAGASERGPSLLQDPQPPHIKEEQEEETLHCELITSRLIKREDQLSGRIVSVNDADDEEPPTELLILETYSQQCDPTTEPSRDHSDLNTYFPKDSNSFSCPVCEQTFVLQRQLDSHMTSHMCPVSEEELLSLEQTAQVTQEKPFSCSVCGMRFLRKKSLKRHMLRHIAPLTLQEKSANKKAQDSCSHCGKVFLYQRCLTKHMKTHMREVKPFSCTVCGREFELEAELQSHVPLHKPRESGNDGGSQRKGFACSDCGKVFYYQTCLKKHMSAHENDLGCAFCQMRFKSKTQLDRHVSSHTSKTNQEPSSEQDESRFKVHPEDKPFKCGLCKGSFWKKRQFNHHMLQHEKQKLIMRASNRGALFCPDCGMSFKLQRSLTKHMKIHSGRREDRPFSCSVCGAGFSGERLLKHHMLSHESRETGHKMETEYRCSYCGRLCFSQKGLRQHMVTHKDGLRCPLCQMMFKNQSQLDHHAMNHTSEGNKETEEMENSETLSFEDDKELNNLLEVGTEKSDLNCSLCGEGFQTKTELDCHTSSHKEEEQPPSSSEDALKSENRSDAAESSFRRSVRKLNQKNKSEHHETETESKNRGLTCSYCNKVFLYEKWFRKHALKHQQEFVCSCCHWRFKQSSQLDEHMLSHTADDDQTLGSECHKDTETLVDAEQEQPPSAETDALQARYPCPYCDQVFSIQKWFVKHKQLHQQFGRKAQLDLYLNKDTDVSEDTPPFSAENNQTIKSEAKEQSVCDVESTSERQETEAGSKRRGYTCSYCNKVLFLKSAFTKHMLMHKEEFICLYCQKRFRRRTQLDYHLSSHMNRNRDNKLPSSLENIQMLEKEELERHTSSQMLKTDAETEDEELSSPLKIVENLMMSSEYVTGVYLREGQTEERPYSCSVCGTGFDQNNELQSHMSSHTSEKVQPSSSENNKTLSSEVDQVEKSDIKAQPEERTLGCSVYGAVFSQKNKLERHIWRHLTEINAQTEDKNVKTLRSDKEESNLKVPSEETLFKCELCVRTFSKRRRFAHHMSLHRNKKIKSRPFERMVFACSECDRRFCHPTWLNKHMKLHSGETPREERPFSCSVCGMGFNRERLLTVHMLSHSEKDEAEEPENRCAECGKVLSSAGRLIQHMGLMHVKEKSGQIFKEESVLELREAAEGRPEEGPFSCSVCGVTFTEENELERHTSSHGLKKTSAKTDAKQKQYLCLECGKVFYYCLILRKHKLMHKKQKTRGGFNATETDNGRIPSLNDRDDKKECTVCGKKVNNLKSHMIVHKNTFSCSVCEKSFNHEENLGRHMKLKHHEPRQRSKPGNVLRTKTTGAEPRRFSCRLCSKRFRRFDERLLHQKIHQEPRRFSCRQLSPPIKRATKQAAVAMTNVTCPNPAETCPNPAETCSNPPLNLSKST